MRSRRFQRIELFFKVVEVPRRADSTLVVAFVSNVGAARLLVQLDLADGGSVV